jgi:hypothetical protein
MTAVAGYPPVSPVRGADAVVTSQANGVQAGGSVGTYRGRKFVPRPKQPPSRHRIPKNVNLEVLHQALEEDTAAVASMKREMHRYFERVTMGFRDAVVH